MLKVRMPMSNVKRRERAQAAKRSGCCDPALELMGYTFPSKVSAGALTNCGYALPIALVKLAALE
jgi:hypothetical protein